MEKKAKKNFFKSHLTRHKLKKQKLKLAFFKKTYTFFFIRTNQWQQWIINSGSVLFYKQTKFFLIFPCFKL